MLRGTLALVTFGLLHLPGVLHAQPPDRWTLVRDLRIGNEDRANYSLSIVGDVAVGPGGEIYVAQPQEKLIRQYDARGTFLRAIGRAGSGPGEFQDLDRIGWKGDTLWAADRNQYRVNFFTRTGRALGTAGRGSPVVPGSGRPTPPSAALIDGSMLGWPTPTTSGVQAGSVRTLPLLRMNRAGAIQGGFGTVEVLGAFESIRRARLVMNLTLPVPFNSLWDVAPNGSSVVVVHRGTAESADRSTFRVASYRASGSAVFDRVYYYTPRTIPAASRDSIHEMLADQFVRTGFVQAQAQARSFARDSVFLPRFQPPVSDVAVGRDGTIWLGRERLGVRSVEYLVLGPDGGILASVAAPPGLRILQAQRDMVWGVESDEFDVPYIVRYRVTPAR
jgi:hypothetical protein